MYLLDINIWLALVFEAHAHHDIVRQWFDKIGDENCAFCRMTQQGFLRLSTNPAVFGKESLSIVVAWKTYETILNDLRVYFFHEPDGLDTVWRQYTGQKIWSHKIWNDAYLAAFAKCAGQTIVSLDRDFRKFKKLDYVILRN